ncbi:MAG: ribonuclease HII [Elusimicrobiaceae bacterium]|nr:ribonuclease HII [Elusimicrobiaceae bacterium]
MTRQEFDEELAREYSAGSLIGIDEAGRGPLAGPVTACACVLPKTAYPLLAEVNDSKQLSPKKREKLYELLKQCGARYSVAFVAAAEIDRINILQATFKAMREAAAEVAASLASPLCVVDGNHKIRDFSLPQTAVVKGDSRSLCVAAASVIAKVERDRYMRALDVKYPGYGFAGHKGYGTAAHMRAIAEKGPCPEHRTTFIPDDIINGLKSRARQLDFKFH